jgi:hypothetical protein
MTSRAAGLAFILFGLAVSPAFAQGVNAGVEAGLSMSRVSPDLPGQTITRGPGLLAGAWISFQPWVPVGIEIELVYAQKRSHLSSSSDLKLDYLEVPILAKLKLFRSIYMLEGIAFDFPLSAKVSGSGGDTDIKSSITSPDIGMIIAGGIPLSRHVSVEFRYEGGFKNFSSAADAPAQRNRSLTGIVRITR